jgi:hypothetical protein
MNKPTLWKALWMLILLTAVGRHRLLEHVQAEQPSGRQRTTADREVASTITLPSDQQIVTRAQCMEWEAHAEEACLVEHQCLEWQVRKKARKAEKCHRKSQFQLWSHG